MSSSGKRSRPLGVWWAAASALVAVLMVFSACGPDASQAQAQQNKARLDGELQRARGAGMPDSMLRPIETQEAQLASGAGGLGYSYKNAADGYAHLFTQLLGIEQTSIDTLRQQATKDVDTFSTVLTQRKEQGFTEVQAYQTRLAQLTQQLNDAKTASALIQVDAAAQAQEHALTAMWPAYQQLQQFSASVQALQKVGIDTSVAQVEYADDLKVFRDGASADRYARLLQVIQGQTVQLMADQTQAMPYVGASILENFQAQISLLTSFGEDASTFQQEHDSDVTSLQQARTLADYLTLSQTVNQQSQDMALPMARGQARHDLQVLQNLVDQVEAQNPLQAYEYANPSVGDGDAQYWFDQAAYFNDPVWGYNMDDQESVSLTVNLRAMLDNMNDPTSPDKPHQTDLELMRYYGFLSGQVTVVSLREQTARVYQDGKMVWWSYVTTGRFERPTPPGLHYAISKATHVEFLPTEPIGSPIRGYPTPINFAINYNSVPFYQFDGFFLHDAWWRVGFGPGSNLPHWDPAAFDGGSHGCINFPLDNMGWYYNWVDAGTPVIVY